MLAIAHMLVELGDDGIHGLLGVGILNLLDTGFTVNAKSEFGHAFWNAGFFRRPWNRTGIQRHADCLGPGNDCLDPPGDLVKFDTTFSQSASNLVHEQGSCHAARLRQVGQGNVVIDDDHAYIQPECLCAFRCQPEIQPVAGVVLDDEQAAGRPRHGQDPGQHGINRGRGKHIPAHRGSQHAFPDKSRMRGFVAGPATRDQRHFRLVPVIAHHHPDVGVPIKPGKLAARRCNDTIDRIRDEVFLAVHKLRHRLPPETILAPSALK